MDVFVVCLVTEDNRRLFKSGDYLLAKKLVWQKEKGKGV